MPFVLLILIGLVGPATPALAQEGNIEPDARQVPWPTVRRLALLAGEFPSPIQPLSREELSRIFPRYRSGWAARPSLLAPGLAVPAPWWVGQRLDIGFQELGAAPAGEAGRLEPAGGYLVWEPTLEYAAGHFWLGLSARGGGRLWEGAGPLAVDHPLVYSSWPLAAGRGPAGQARTLGGAWDWELTRYVVGYRRWGWSWALGRFPARTGPGSGGALVFDRSAPTFPMVQMRRTRPFRWSGWMRPLAPENFLLRAGRLSRREIRYEDEYGRQIREAEPWFFQWLMGWKPWNWLRLTCTQGTMATPREGTLWPDLLQINFPVTGTTWRERDSGPITDRIFAVQVEFLWRDAPWLFLPGEAGRAYWDYGGTDFLPSGPGGVFPEISLPASIAGVELVSPRWDLNLEYFQTHHHQVLWYSNSGYREGYTQEGWVLGHPAGGGAQGGLLRVGWRPVSRPLEVALQVRHTDWEHERFLPGEAKRLALGLQLGLDPARSRARNLWTAEVGWSREEVQPTAGEITRLDSWRFLIRVSSY